MIFNAVDQIELPLGITRVSPAAIKDAHALTSLSEVLAAVKILPFTPHAHQPAVVENDVSTKKNVRHSRIGGSLAPHQESSTRNSNRWAGRFLVGNVVVQVLQMGLASSQSLMLETVQRLNHSQEEGAAFSPLSASSNMAHRNEIHMPGSLHGLSKRTLRSRPFSPIFIYVSLKFFRERS
jgi:hypothetical protein